MRDHWGNPVGEARDDPLNKSTNDLTRRELRDLIGDAVFRGVLKAIAVYLLISALIWIVVKIIVAATAYG